MIEQSYEIGFSNGRWEVVDIDKLEGMLYKEALSVQCEMNRVQEEYTEFSEVQYY